MDHGLWTINCIPSLSLARFFVVFPKVLMYEKVPDFIVGSYDGYSILS